MERPGLTVIDAWAGFGADAAGKGPAKGNIYIIGFMCSGKTAVGELLASRLSMGFADTDSMVRELDGRSIPEIFAASGEEYFRSLETECLAGLAITSGVVVATGGGIVCREANLSLMGSSGLTVRLRVSPEDVMARAGDISKRPLLNTADPLGRIEELMRNREPKYRKADISIDTRGKSVEQVCDEVAEALAGSGGLG